MTVASILGGLWYAPFFLAGWFVADLYATTDRTRSGTIAWDVAAIVGIVASIGLFLDGREVAVIVVAPVMLGLLLIGTLRGRLVRRALGHPILTVIGGMAYSIYLIHYPILVLWGRWAMTHPWAANPIGVVLAVTGALAMSVVFFLAIVRPSMDPRWFARITGRLRAADPATDVRPEPLAEPVATEVSA
jgi:peptidoglycan/LPS O-acetylase OafA/YrhL